MKARWKKFADRIDALSLRERALLFCAALVVLVSLPYSLIVSPSFAKQKTILDRILRDQSQINSMQKELQAVVASQSAEMSAEDRQKLENLERQLAEIENRSREHDARVLTAAQISDLLRTVLAKGGHLQLVALNALPGVPVLPPASEPEKQPDTRAGAQPSAQTAPQTGAAKAASSAKSSEPAGDQQLFKLGFEITVKGSYFDSLRYLDELERLPSGLLWGNLKISTDQYPTVTLKATLYSLSRGQAVIAL